jgi:2,3-bisphosphoglycerate-independent phosphoglycerate mutase
VVDVLVILDGASEPARGGEPTSLERAHTPALDGGELSWVEHLPAGLPVGSETAIAALLGWVPEGPVDRGAIEAAARGIELAPGERAWRVDLLGRHKLLLVGTPPLPQLEADGLKVWPSGAVPPHGILDSSTVVIGAPGAATGLARLLGAKVVVPPGATGRPNSDLGAKRRAALDAIGGGAERIVVHVGGPDEAAHDRDRDAKVASLEAADRELVGPLVDAVLALGGKLRACPDHGCDPATGEHVGGPVPCLTWEAD